MTSHKGKSAWNILGSPDDLKFRSCLTLDICIIPEETDACFIVKDHAGLSLANVYFRGRARPASGCKAAHS
jgi:hypothetical protein